MNCPNCGTAHEIDDVFCVNCGQPLASATSPAPKARRPRWLLLLPLLLLLVGLVGLLWLLDLLPASLPTSPLASNSQPRPLEIVQTKDPFLILQAYRDDQLDVFAADLDGNPLVSFGASADWDHLPLSVVDDPYGPWPRSLASPVTGAGAWARPDGGALVGLRTSEGWDLLRYDAGRGEIHELVQSVFPLVVSGLPNAERFLIYYRLAGQHRLATVGELNGPMVSLVASSAPSRDHTLAPDGQQAVIQSDDLFIASTDGRRVYRQQGQFDTFVFSPDSRHLFYTSGPQLIRADGDGRNAQVIAQVGRSDRLWLVSASDEYVAVQHEGGGSYELRVLDRKGEVVSRTGRSNSPYQARYLPGKQGLLIASQQDNRWQIDLANVRGEKPRTLAQGLQDFWLLPLPTDRHLALAAQQDGRWSLALHELRQEQMQVVAQGLYSVTPLAANNETLVVAAQGDSGWSLLAIPIAQGDVVELDAGAEQGYPRAFFLPDGREIVYEAAQGVTQNETTRSDGVTVMQPVLAGGVYRTNLQNPAPIMIYDNASLLAASLFR